MSEIVCKSPVLRISNVRVYDLYESLIAAGYPVRTQARDLGTFSSISQKDLDRGTRLSKATLKGNQAHDQFLTGIRVNFDLRLSNKAWVEAERYRFLEFVSSQSTMHCITKFDVAQQCNDYVDREIVNIISKKVERYRQLAAEKERLESIDAQEKESYKLLQGELKELYLQILYSTPAGFELTARMSTNYRCLKNIYKQRHDHRLFEWREVCEWIKSLPHADKLILCCS